MLIAVQLITAKNVETHQCSSKLEWINCDLSYNGTSYSNENEGPVITCNNVDEPHKYNFERKKWDTKVPT